MIKIVYPILEMDKEVLNGKISHKFDSLKEAMTCSDEVFIEKFSEHLKDKEGYLKEAKKLHDNL